MTHSLNGSKQQKEFIALYPIDRNLFLTVNQISNKFSLFKLYILGTIILLTFLSLPNVILKFSIANFKSHYFFIVNISK